MKHAAAVSFLIAQAAAQDAAAGPRAIAPLLSEAQRPLVNQFRPLRYRTSLEVEQVAVIAAMRAEHARGAITQEIPIHVVRAGAR